MVFLYGTSLTSTSKDLAVGFPGATKLRINWYVDAPQTLSRTARCLPLSLIPLAIRYCSSHLVYEIQSS